MSWVLLIAAFYVSDVGEESGSMFDQPTNWGRIVIVCTLIICAVILHVFSESSALHVKFRDRSDR